MRRTQVRALADGGFFLDIPTMVGRVPYARAVYTAGFSGEGPGPQPRTWPAPQRSGGRPPLTPTSVRPRAAGLWNSSAGVNDACVLANAGHEWRCMFAQYTLPHVKTPLFVVEGMCARCMPSLPAARCHALARVAPANCSVVAGTSSS